jgi:hypothetical protein
MASAQYLLHGSWGGGMDAPEKDIFHRVNFICRFSTMNYELHGNTRERGLYMKDGRFFHDICRPGHALCILSIERNLTLMN